MYLNSRSKTKNDENKKDFKFFIKRALKEYTVAEVEFSKLFAQLEAIRIGCKGSHKTSTGLFQACETPKEYFTLTSEE